MCKCTKYFYVHYYVQSIIFTSNCIELINPARFLVEEHRNKKYQPPKDINPEHQELMQKIGIRLQTLRKEKKISSSGLAKQLGISRNAYHQMEAGKVYFNVLSLIKVLHFHQLTLKEFFTSINWTL